MQLTKLKNLSGAHIRHRRGMVQLLPPAREGLGVGVAIK